MSTRHRAGARPRPGREGTRAVRHGLLRGAEVSVVVNREHTLHMPSYGARVLHWLVAPTRVDDAPAGSTDFPGGRGWLASYLVEITNTTNEPLDFAEAGRRIDLIYPTARNTRDGIMTTQQFGIRGSQGSPPGRYGPIAPHASAVGWTTFVVAIWARELLHERAADLEFWRPGRYGRAFNGQIRLWK